MESYVYILISEKDGRCYIGSTVNLPERIAHHNQGLVKSTKYRRPLKLFAHRKFTTISEAVKYEKKYKNSSGQIERDIKNGKLIVFGE
jgi:putative endonuclease